MDNNIETTLQASLALAEKKFKNDKTVQLFEKTNNEFKELVVKGLVQKRGNNLLSASDKQFVAKIIFNAE